MSSCRSFLLFNAPLTSSVIHLHERDLADAVADKGVGVQGLGAGGSFLILLPTVTDVRAAHAALTHYAGELEVKRDREGAGGVWRMVRDVELHSVTTESPLGQQLRFFSTGCPEGFRRESERGRARVIVCVETSLVDEVGSIWVPGVSAIIDCGFTRQRTFHPFLPLSVTYDVVSAASQTTLVERMVNLAPPRHKRGTRRGDVQWMYPAYYLLMEEKVFGKLPTITSSPLMKDSSSLIVLALFAACVTKQR